VLAAASEITGLPRDNFEIHEISKAEWREAAKSSSYWWRPGSEGWPRDKWASPKKIFPNGPPIEGQANLRVYTLHRVSSGTKLG
jgi:hypothetical protein